MQRHQGLVASESAEAAAASRAAPASGGKPAMPAACCAGARFEHVHVASNVLPIKPKFRCLMLVFRKRLHVLALRPQIAPRARHIGEPLSGAIVRRHAGAPCSSQAGTVKGHIGLGSRFIISSVQCESVSERGTAKPAQILLATMVCPMWPV